MSANLPGATTSVINCRLLAPTIVTAASIATCLILRFMCCSSSFARGELVRQLVRIVQVLELHLLEFSRRLEAETICRHFASGLPVADIDRVLRPAVDFGAPDHVAAGIGTSAMGDPDLDIDVGHAKGEVIAFGAANNTAAQVVNIYYLRHQPRIHVRRQ